MPLGDEGRSSSEFTVTEGTTGPCGGVTSATSGSIYMSAHLDGRSCHGGAGDHTAGRRPHGPQPVELASVRADRLASAGVPLQQQGADAVRLSTFLLAATRFYRRGRGHHHAR